MGNLIYLGGCCCCVYGWDTGKVSSSYIHMNRMRQRENMERLINQSKITQIYKNLGYCYSDGGTLFITLFFFNGGKGDASLHPPI